MCKCYLLKASITPGRMYHGRYFCDVLAQCRLPHVVPSSDNSCSQSLHSGAPHTSPEVASHSLVAGAPHEQQVSFECSVQSSLPQVPIQARMKLHLLSIFFVVLCVLHPFPVRKKGFIYVKFALCPVFVLTLI